MRIISWNINSVRARLPRLLGLLQRHEPDVVCLQEIKVHHDNCFPVDELDATGYRSIVYGQHNFNGVAILVRDPSRKYALNSWSANSFKPQSELKPLYVLTDIKNGFPNDPVKNEARVLSICVGDLRIVNVYVINGEGRESNQFKDKQRWMAALGNWLHSLPVTPPLLVVGDFNVAPDDRDVWDPIGLKDRIHCTIEERSWLNALQGNRLCDLLRVVNNDHGIYTWWPYQRDAFERNEGLRFDLALGDQAIAHLVKKVWVDKEERGLVNKLVKPSDHAPLIIDLAQRKTEFKTVTGGVTYRSLDNWC
jgi:exodeoxyribonuclease-3